MKIIVVTPDFGAGDVPLGKLYAEAFAELGHETFFLAQNSRVTDISFLGRSFSYSRRVLISSIILERLNLCF